MHSPTSRPFKPSFYYPKSTHIFCYKGQAESHPPAAAACRQLLPRLSGVSIWKPAHRTESLHIKLNFRPEGGSAGRRGGNTQQQQERERQTDRRRERERQVSVRQVGGKLGETGRANRETGKRLQVLNRERVHPKLIYTRGGKESQKQRQLRPNI